MPVTMVFNCAEGTATKSKKHVKAKSQAKRGWQQGEEEGR